jgi:hypothetical protein
MRIVIVITIVMVNDVRGGRCDVHMGKLVCWSLARSCDSISSDSLV